MGHRYRGHRAASFSAEDEAELVELRARQRTYHGAYLRTALGTLGYALVILKLFDKRFYRIGLVYLLLSGLLFIASLMRAAHSNHDFADDYKANESNLIRSVPQRDVEPARVISSVGQGGRNFGRPFVTSGWIVVVVTGVVSVVEESLQTCRLALVACAMSPEKIGARRSYNHHADRGKKKFRPNLRLTTFHRHG